MGFDLSKYETVKSRKTRFYEDYKDGRIIVESISDDVNVYAYFKASIFLNADDQKNNLAKSTGYAHEIRDTQLKQGRNGEYESVNFGSWNENCEESAIGRALDNAGYASNGKCSAEEMQQVEKKNKSYPNSDKPIKFLSEENYKKTILLEDVSLIDKTIEMYSTDTWKMKKEYREALVNRIKTLNKR